MAASLNSAVVYLLALDAVRGQGVAAPAYKAGAPGWRRRLRERQALRHALGRAYQGFARQHPEWAASLFDEHFIARRVEPLLFGGLSHSSRQAPADLARAWADQFGPSRRDGQPPPGAGAVEVAADFLARLAIELGRNS
jgi:hypothetical protein